MRVIIDRFEGEYAVVELGEKLLNVPRELFAGAKEGDAAEITVTGRAKEGEESPHELFMRLRRNSADIPDSDDNSAVSD